MISRNLVFELTTLRKNYCGKFLDKAYNVAHKVK